MKLNKRLLTSVISMGLAASIGFPTAGIVMAQDTGIQSDVQEENEIVFTADGGNEVLSVGQKKEEEKPDDDKPVDPDRPYHEDDYYGDLELSSNYVTLDRDYAQTVKVKVSNETNKIINYYLEADNGNEDIYLNFVQLGSQNAPLTISPYSEQEVELSIFLQNALNESYSIPIRAFTRDGSSGDEYAETSLYTVDFLCDHGDVSFSLLEGDLNEETLSQTYTVKNNGDELTDLTISVSDTLSRYVSVSSLIENYTIGSGETISFDVKPDLFNMEEDGKDTVTGEIIASSGAHKQTANVTFKKPENFKTIEAWRLALYQEDNPYYLIDEEPEIESKVFEAITALDDSAVTKEDVAGALGINSSTGMINISSDNITYSYIDENGKEQELRFETEISTETTSDKSKTGTTFHSYKQEDDNIVFENTFHLSGDETKEYVTDYLDGARDLFNLKKGAIQIADDIYKDINGVNMDDTTLKFITKVADTGWSALRNDKDTKNIVKALDKINKTYNEIIDSVQFIDYISVLNNPNYSEEFKKDTASKATFSALDKLLSKAATTIPGVGSFHSYSWKIGTDKINKMTKSIHHPKSNEELGLYNKKKVAGSQCTNAGSITNYPDSTVGNGIKKNPISKGSAAFDDIFDFYTALPYMTDRDILDRADYISEKYKANRAVKINKVGEDRIAEADVEEDKNVTGDKTDKNLSLVFITGRIEGVEDDYTDTLVTEQTIRVNNSEVGKVSTKRLSDVFIAGMLTDLFNIGEINEVERVFNTNPGSHSIDTDTEYNFFIPDSTLIAYTGTLDDIEDIRSLPDFAVYPENIYSSDDNYIGDSNPVTVKVYNRGPRGGWTDVEVKIDGNTVHREENKYISGFSGEEITFDFTPTSEKHTVSVTLNNKSVETQERTEENNVVESKDIYFKRYEVPEIVEITPDTIRIADTDEGAFVKAAITKDYTVKKVIFKFDDEALSEEAYTPGIGEASVYIPKEKLTVGDHKLTAELVYKENATTDNTISEEKQINVKIKESINFAVKTDEESYVNYTVLRKNKYDGRQYYSSSYIVSSVDRKYNAEKKQYECKMYLYEDMQITDDYDVILVYDNGIQLIPLNELNGSTFSMDGAKKVTTEYTDAFSNIYINKPLKINGYELNEWIDGWYSYRDNFLVGDGIDSLEMKVDYNVSGGSDSVTESLDMTKGDGVITLVDNTKTITFTNYAGNIPNREIVAESGDDYYYLDCSFNTSDNNKMMAVLTSEANKQFQDADKVIFYFMDDEAIYEFDLKTLAEDVVDLESIRNNYNKVSYVYDSSNTQILSRTIQRKKENSGAGTGTYELKTDNILAATGEYIIKTKYKSKGIVLEDTQEIVVSGTDVEIVLPEAEEEMTTISVVYPDYYTSVYLEYYDDNDDWHSERVESGDKIVAVPGRRDYRINATTYDGLDLTLKRTVDVTDKTNTEINLCEHFAANVHISNIESDTNIFATDSGSTVSFDLTDFKDEYGSDLYNYSDYYSYDYETKATLKLTDVNDKSKQYEVNYPYGVDYIDYGERVLSFTLPNDIKGDYNYEIVLSRTVPDPPIPLEGIKLDKNELTIEPGSEDVLTVTYIPEDTTDSKVIWWESSDEETVKVEDGKLKALQEGTATITVYSDEDYGINDSCEVTVKHMHDMQTVLAKDPTCTESGNKEYYICNKCEKWYEDKEGTREITDKASVEIAPLGHDYEESITKEAGCEEAGVRTFTCKHDQAHTYTEDIPATGHDWGEWTIVKAATETETGQRTRICKNDATHTENEEIPKLTHIHTITEVAGIEPTCEEDGIRAHFKCEKCGNLFEDAQAAVMIDDPDSVIIKAFGHSWGEWKVTKEANCTEKGVETRSCLTDAAHTEEREISATGHSLIKTESKEAGCETAGNIEYYTCSACGHMFSDAKATNEIVLSQTVIEPIGHDWSAWSVSKAATCTNSGEEIRTCAHDGEIQTRAIPPLDHAWGEWQVSKEATETESGERIRICSHDASHVDIEIIPATGKKPDDTEAPDNNEEDRPADYTKTDAAIAKVPKDTSIYTPESVQAAQAAISAVVRGKKISEQAEVDAFTKAIEDALAALELKDADYGAVEKAKSKIPPDAELTKYTEESVNRVKAAVEAVVGGKKIDEQTIVDDYAKAIEDAIAALVLKSGGAADNPGSHTDDTKNVKQDAPESEPVAASLGKKSSVTNTGSTAARTGESAAVTTTEDSNTVQATSTGDNGATLVWMIIAGVSAVAALGAALLRQRKKEDK